KNKAVSKVVSLNFTTDRGIVLLNVPPNEVSSDLRERPLTNAAKAIIRSGDTYLMDAIRRASPKYFGDYARTLPPARRQPVLSVRTAESDSPPASIKRATVHVTDAFNRAVPGLAAPDFSVTENGAEREIVKLETTNAPFNLVLLLDVSGSVDNYVNFIRKAARSFVDTVDRRDRVSIVLFNDDVKVLSKFTTDKGRLSESLDTFDAGGATAYYDALAYTLADTLRPLKGERTAIVILTDGDDNRSFLSFDGIIGAIEESGALIYPLYVPSALIASSSNGQLDNVDPLRARYMTLTSKAEGEGAKLAAISGGIYYPISQLSQIQTAYDDIVVQLRSAYVLTFRSQAASGETRPSLRLKVKVNKPNTFTSVGPIVRLN
ncbi:MAG TPA: VWA domain-containing protein, partial [Pyrinomonadaceae bacterium]|nr:VWA domain-containing protein [Pyrinomonadaceae bacterium]